TGHVSIQTGSGGLGKSYPIKQWDVVAQTLRSEGYRVVYIGGPSDPQPCGELDNFVGKLSLRESMGVIASSALHLAGDTGTGHIAAAYGTPGVSIFGPMPSSVYRPFSPKTVVLERGGRPENITTDEVIEAALNQLRRFS
ncbi:MAG: glycosyltransferase family 9 protein, partial [Fimbriimonadaceae bacterium]|nr:glycosyltransferase family 9 protein [Fimbriimonadaceae bacterium]